MTKRPSRGGKWSAEVTRNSDALDVRPKIFTSEDPEKIASSLKRSAEHSSRRKSNPFRSAMSMLTFYINRGGANLSPHRRKLLEAAKSKLREIFGRRAKRH